MSKYLLRRTLISIPVLIGISAVLFTILALAPGDPFEELATNPNVPAEVRMNLRAKFGLDDPLPLRYARWVVSMMRGDWGFSFVSRVNVDTLILQRLPATLIVLGSAQLLAVLIAIPIGTYSALRPYSFFDQAATTLAFIGFSLPTFFTGLLFILLFSIHLDWLPFIYRADISATGWRWYWEHVRQAIMPVAALKRPSVASAAPTQSTAAARRITGESVTRLAPIASVSSAGGITAANATRHEPLSTNQPPSIGLTAPMTAVAADHVPMARPR